MEPAPLAPQPRETSGRREATGGGRPRVAVVEAFLFHAEVTFACAATVDAAGGCDLHVFAPDVLGSREWLRDGLGIPHAWHPPEALERETGERETVERGTADPPYDLVIVGTFPPPGGAEAVDRVVAVGRAALGLVHDIAFFADPEGAEAVLRRHPRLHLAHAGVAPPAGVARLPEELRRRVTRFFPVFRHDARPDEAEGGASPFGRREGVALPGMIEFSRRDYGTAVRLSAEAGVRLNVVGRSRDTLGAAKDLRRLLDEVAGRSVPPGLVSVAADVTSREFYRAVDASRFVAVMTVNPEYVRGKLTAAVTAAVSCGVPLLMRRDVHAHFAAADAATFGGCLAPFDPGAPAGRADEWGFLARGMPGERYDALWRETLRAREALIAENARTVRRLLDGEPPPDAGPHPPPRAPR